MRKLTRKNGLPCWRAYVGDSTSQIIFWSGHHHPQRSKFLNCKKGDNRLVFWSFKSAMYDNSLTLLSTPRLNSEFDVHQIRQVQSLELKTLSFVSFSWEIETKSSHNKCWSMHRLITNMHDWFHHIITWNISNFDTFKICSS